MVVLGDRSSNTAALYSVDKQVDVQMFGNWKQGDQPNKIRKELRNAGDHAEELYATAESRGVWSKRRHFCFDFAIRALNF